MTFLTAYGSSFVEGVLVKLLDVLSPRPASRPRDIEISFLKHGELSCLL